MWVVRETAEQSIRYLLKQDAFDVLLPHLPVIHTLLDKRRTDLAAIHKEIVQHITRTDLSELVYAQIKKLPDKNRVLYVQYYLKAGKLTYKTAQLLLTDKSPLVRSQLVRKMSVLKVSEQLELLKIVLQDESSEVRSKAFAWVSDFRPALNPYLWNLVADESAIVRLLARHELREECKSFADYYRNQIKNRQQLTGSILGLAEVGTIQDSQLIESFIADSTPDIQFVSLYALYLLDAAKARTYALQLLAHPSKKIRFKCVYILTGYVNEQVLAQLKIVFQSATPSQKKTLLHLLNNQSGWEVLPELLLATQDSDSAVQNLTWRFLRNWQQKASRLYTVPSPVLIQKIEEAFQFADFKKMNMDHNRKQLWKEIGFAVKHAMN